MTDKTQAPNPDDTATRAAALAQGRIKPSATPVLVRIDPRDGGLTEGVMPPERPPAPWDLEFSDERTNAPYARASRPAGRTIDLSGPVVVSRKLARAKLRRTADCTDAAQWPDLLPTPKR